MPGRTLPEQPGPYALCDQPPLPPQEQVQVCDVCGRKLRGEPAGRGMLMWMRGDEMRIEEPALCGRCAHAITAASHRMWADPDDEE